MLWIQECKSCLKVCVPHSSPSLFPSLIFFLPLSLGGTVTVVPLCVCIRQSFIFCISTSYESWQWTLTTEKRLPWLKLTAALFYGYKHRHLESNLTGTSCTFTKTTAVASEYGPWSSQTLVLDGFTVPDMSSQAWNPHRRLRGRKNMGETNKYMKGEMSFVW